MKRLLARFALAAVALSFACPARAESHPPIDAGGYLLDYTPGAGWAVKSSTESGAIIIQLIEKVGNRVRHLAEYRVLKITVPADQRAMSLDEVAKALCDGDNSYAGRVMFPTTLDHNLRKREHHRVGSRELAVYAYADSDAKSATPSVSIALAYVWVPDSFKSDGGLYLISAFEFLVASATPTGDVRSDIKDIDTVIAAIKPR